MKSTRLHKSGGFHYIQQDFTEINRILYEIDQISLKFTRFNEIHRISQDFIQTSRISHEIQITQNQMKSTVKLIMKSTVKSAKEICIEICDKSALCEIHQI